jgi:hypothetical protein
MQTDQVLPLLLWVHANMCNACTHVHIHMCTVTCLLWVWSSATGRTNLKMRFLWNRIGPPFKQKQPPPQSCQSLKVWHLLVHVKVVLLKVVGSEVPVASLWFLGCCGVLTHYVLDCCLPLLTQLFNSFFKLMESFSALSVVSLEVCVSTWICLLMFMYLYLYS